MSKEKMNLNGFFDIDTKPNNQTVKNLFYGQNQLDNGIIETVALEKLVPFKEHTFNVVDDQEMDDLVESIRERGVFTPAIAFVNDDGELELISGHRRKRACEILQLPSMPVIIKENMTRDDAIIMMGEANLRSRDKILPSEKARTYMKMFEAMKRQGKRVDLIYETGGRRTDQILSDKVGESRNQIARYIRLNYLNNDLLKLVDRGIMALIPAVEVSYLSGDSQQYVYNYYVETAIFDDKYETELGPGVLPSVGQAKKMRALENEGMLDEDAITKLLEHPKPNQVTKVVLKDEKILAYSKDMTPAAFQKKVLAALEYYEKHCKNKEKTIER